MLAFMTETISTSDSRVRRLRVSDTAVGCLVVLCLSCLAPLASGQDLPSLVRFIDDDSLNFSPPTFSTDAQAIALDVAVLRKLRRGDFVPVEVGPGDVRNLELTEVGDFINGDQVFRVQGQDQGAYFSLVLTLGSRSLYGHLSSAQGIYQIVAAPAESGFAGWLYRPRGLESSSAGFQNDYVIRKPDPEAMTPAALPLLLGNTQSQQGSSNQAATQSGISDSNFKITQKFSRQTVRLDQTVEIQLQFENVSTTSHKGLSVDIYFVLENSFLNLAPGQCTSQLSTSQQKVLHCVLGDFAPGEKKSFVYSVLATEQSKPHIISTAIVGSVRSDVYINVVDDVRTDQDGDGISDFNEQLLGTDALDPNSVDRSNSTIDVMAVYTPGARDLYPFGIETRINQLISVANQVYQDSGVAITLRPVYHGLVNYNDTADMDTALSAIIDKTDPAFAEIDKLRNTYGADLVILFRPLGAERGKCGLAPVGGLHTEGDFSNTIEKQYAYSNIGIDCPVDLVVAHELGHNMGLTHSHLEDGMGGTFNFSTGYGVDSAFVTVMAYPGAFKTNTRIALFSSPDLDCQGFPCGVDSQTEFGADAVQSLNLVRHQLANYYPTRIPDLPVHMVATLDGTDTTAAIALAASIDGGLSYVQNISPADRTDVSADIHVDSRHVGKTGFVTALVQFGNKGYFQLHADGSKTPWDGSRQGLSSFAEISALRGLEHLKLLDDFQPVEDLIGQQISIYLAYQLTGSGELIYTPEPLVINVVAPSAPVFSTATANLTDLPQ